MWADLILSLIPNQTSRTRLSVWGFHDGLLNSRVSLNGFPRRTTRCFLLSPCVSWETWFSWASKLTNFSWQRPSSVPGNTDDTLLKRHWSKNCRKLTGHMTMIYQKLEKWSRSWNKRRGEFWKWRLKKPDISLWHVLNESRISGCWWVTKHKIMQYLVQERYWTK